MLFNEMNLCPEIIQAIEEQDYTKATPIQEQAIPPLLEGKDILGCAQTGTGKTAAFAIPILQQIGKEPESMVEFNHIKALILAPTRELAIQIGESFSKYGKYTDVQTGVVFGGVTPKRHIKVLKREPRVLVATPGRLMDLVGRECADLSHVEYLVLDEADRMLDLGMKEDVKTILKMLPKKRQNMLFSATMPQEVMSLVHTILHKPVKIEVASTPSKKAKIKEQVYFVNEPDKSDLLIHLLKTMEYESVLVFVKTKKRADKVCKAINIENIRAKAIHGDKNQSERSKALYLFKQKEVKVLVATDVAARGIDIDDLSHVINFNIPTVAETYVHRIGRTGRAGKSGVAIAFCDHQEKYFLSEIEKLQGKALDRVE